MTGARQDYRKRCPENLGSTITEADYGALAIRRGVTPSLSSSPSLWVRSVFKEISSEPNSAAVIISKICAGFPLIQLR